MRNILRNSDVIIGGEYIVKISSHIVVVRILEKAHRKGWIALNLRTGNEVHVKTAAKLRGTATHNPQPTTH